MFINILQITSLNELIPKVYSMKTLLVCIFIMMFTAINAQNNCDSIRAIINDYTGTCTTFHKNGSLAKLKTYKEGELNGKYQEHHFNGQKLASAYFESENISDSAFRYYSNGNLRLTITLDSLKNGKLMRYYKNGKLHVDGQFTNGVRSGVWKTYNSKGELVSENTKTENERINVILTQNPDFQWKHTTTDEFFLGIF